MESAPASSVNSLSVNGADRFARSISNQAIGVVRRGDGRVYLIRIGCDREILLRPDLTEDYILSAIRMNDPWPAS